MMAWVKRWWLTHFVQKRAFDLNSLPIEIKSDEVALSSLKDIRNCLNQLKNIEPKKISYHQLYFTHITPLVTNIESYCDHLNALSTLIDDKVYLRSIDLKDAFSKISLDFFFTDTKGRELNHTLWITNFKLCASAFLQKVLDLDKECNPIMYLHQLKLAGQIARDILLIIEAI